MEIKKDDIQITSFLVGLHSFRKDHNYGNYKNNLINEIQTLLNLNFESLKIGAVDILKTGLEEEFEIRLTPSTIIYQDKLSLMEITANAKNILDIWLKYSPNIKLSLVGLVKNFIIPSQKPNDPTIFRLKDQFFKPFKLGDKTKSIDFKFNYIINYKSHDYNVHLSLMEKRDKEYLYQGSLDFNETTENNISGISKESCDRIFDDAKNYFENEFINFINYSD